MSDWVSISPPGNNAKSGALGHGEMMSLDESSFPALELNNRRLSVKNSFCRKNGLYTRCGSLHGGQEDGGLRAAAPLDRMTLGQAPEQAVPTRPHRVLEMAFMLRG